MWALIEDCGSINVAQRPDMKEIVERLRGIEDGDEAPLVMAPAEAPGLRSQPAGDAPEG